MTHTFAQNSLQNKAFRLAYILGVACFIYILMSRRGYDDPYVTYRYARNLASGLGFVYNPGERLLSTTTPLFTLLLAVLAWIGVDLPQAANLIGAFSIGLGGLFFWILAQSWGSPITAWTVLVLYPCATILAITIGSESPLYIALSLGALAAYVNSRYTLSALLAALVVLVRPDGLLLALIMVVHFLFLLRQPIPWRAVVLFVFITLAWALFAWLYFGSPVPGTLAVKQYQGSMLVSQKFFAGFITLLNEYASSWYYWLMAVMALVGLSWLMLKRQHSQWWLLLSWTALYFCAYSLLGVSRYPWYYAPLAPGFLALVGLGLHAVSQVTRHYKYIPTWLLPAGLLLVVALGQVGDMIKLSRSVDNRLPIYTAVGKWLAENTPETSSIGVLEVGIIGYYAGRRMIDFAGLLYPDIAGQLSRAFSYEIAARYALGKYTPDYVVMRSGDFPDLEAYYLQPRCNQVKEFAGIAYGFDGRIKVYACPE